MSSTSGSLAPRTNAETLADLLQASRNFHDKQSLVLRKPTNGHAAASASSAVSAASAASSGHAALSLFNADVGAYQKPMLAFSQQQTADEHEAVMKFMAANMPETTHLIAEIETIIRKEASSPQIVSLIKRYDGLLTTIINKIADRS
jgi:hypothetical protein